VNGDLGLLAGTRPRSGEAGAGAAVDDAEDVVEVRDPRIRWIGHALPRRGGPECLREARETLMRDRDRARLWHRRDGANPTTVTSSSGVPEPNTAAASTQRPRGVPLRRRDRLDTGLHHPIRRSNTLP